MRNVLLVGEESAGIQVLRALARGPHRIVAALTAEPTRGGGATVAGVARTLAVPTLPSEAVADAEFADFVTSEQVDLLLNVHSLFVIHPRVLRAPRIGSFNLHPGPLPEYAGLNAPSWAIYLGEPRHAVTVHWMHPEIDSGPIAYSASFDLSDDDTGLSVSARCVGHGVPLVERLLAAADAGADRIPVLPQDLTRRRYFRRGEVPDGGKLAWNQPARRVVDFVRACDYLPFSSPWGHPLARLGADDAEVLKASHTGEPSSVLPGTVREAEDGAAGVAAADEWVLVHRVRYAGRSRPAGEILVPGLSLAHSV